LLVVGNHILISVALVALSTLAACKANSQQAGETPPGALSATEQPAEKGSSTTGKVVETMNSGRYTYVQIDTGDKKIWAAAPQFRVKLGDAVIVPNGMAMVNYHSQTLDRTFDRVYFVPSVTVMGATRASGGVPEERPRESREDEAVEVDFSEIKKAEGGKTVAELFKNKASLVGEKVACRGKVVRFTAGVMGKNWIHLRDGTGVAGANDLTVTTDAIAGVGDTVLVRGTVVADRDFGFGYRYSLIIEDAEVTVE
jgi:hypothetical protein